MDRHLMMRADDAYTKHFKKKFWYINKPVVMNDHIRDTLLYRVIAFKIALNDFWKMLVGKTNI